MLTLTTFIFFVIAVFCSGIFFAVAGKKLVQFEYKNSLVKIARTIWKKSGYVAAFGAGVFLTSAFEITSSPYNYYRWTGLMDEVTVGSIILDYPEIMETGQVPEDVRAWYARMKAEGQI